jgi:hypothetical protein
MTDKQKAGYQKAIDQGRLLNALIKHDGWNNVLKPRLEAVIQDQRKVWLKASNAETAEIIRLKTAGYMAIFDLVSKILAEGENAQNTLGNSDNKSE